jgi:chemotaxis protein methyltransferase CheR
MRPAEFEQIRSMIYKFCGVDLTGKQVLVGTRLGKRVRDLGFPSFGKYCEHLKNDPSGHIFATTVDLLTTNHTSFFREQKHFDLLRNVIVPELPQKSSLSIWSAACSTGEEPYTIAFSLMEALGEAAWSRVSILATDISSRVLAHAQRGLYPIVNVQGLPPGVLRSCLLKGTGQYADQCMVRREIRSLIDFRRFNLLDDCSKFGPFQVIFCRNVMIYFDQKTQQQVVNNLASRLAPGGYLLIGHSESLNGVEHTLQYVAPATYRRARDREMSFGIHRIKRS